MPLYRFISTLLILSFSINNTTAQKISPIWNYTDLNSTPAEMGHFHADIDNDGKEEIILGNYSSIYILQQTDDAYQFDKTQLYCANLRITDFTLYDEDQDGDDEIFAINVWGEIYKLDLEDGVVTDSLIGDTHHTEPTEIKVSDFNNDGELEFLVAPVLSIHKPYPDNDLITIESFSIVDVQEVELLDINNDGYKEIISSPAGSNNFLLVDGQSLQEIYHTNSITGFIELGDINGDGTIEIINAHEGKVYIRNIQTQELLASFDVEPYFIKDLHLADITNDEGQELLIGGEHLYCYNLNTGSLLWEKPAFDGANDIVGINIYDIDQDEENEIVYSASNTYRGSLFATSTSGETTEYESQDFLFGVNHEIAEFESLGNDNLFMLTNEMVNDEMRRVVRQFSSDTYNLVNMHEFSEGELSEVINVVNDFGIMQARENGQFEILIATYHEIFFFDLHTGQSIFMPLQYIDFINNLIIGDFDADGLSELIVIMGDSSIKIYHFDGNNIVEESSPGAVFDWSLGTYTNTFLTLRQMDEDEQLELLASAANYFFEIDLVDFSIHPLIEMETPQEAIGPFILYDTPSSDLPRFYSILYSQLREFDLNTGELVNQVLINSLYIGSQISIGNYLSEEETHILLTNGKSQYFYHPDDLSLTAEFQSNAFIPNKISSFSATQYDTHQYSLSTDSGVYIFDASDLINTKDINLKNSPEEVLFFPNPTSNSIQNLLSDKGFKYRILSSTGSIIEQGTSLYGSIDFRSLKPGIYFVHVYLNNKHTVKKIIKL